MLILELHEMQSNHVIDSFKKDFQQLDEKCEIIINNEKIYMCSFIMIFLENMLQQNSKC